MKMQAGSTTISPCLQLISVWPVCFPAVFGIGAAASEAFFFQWIFVNKTPCRFSFHERQEQPVPAIF